VPPAAKGRSRPRARALEVVRERWSLLIIRDALFAGSTRYSDSSAALGSRPTSSGPRRRIRRRRDPASAPVLRAARAVRVRADREGSRLGARADRAHRVGRPVGGSGWSPDPLQHSVCGSERSHEVVCPKCDRVNELRPRPPVRVCLIGSSRRPGSARARALRLQPFPAGACPLPPVGSGAGRRPPR
jgi:hypothetical protein